MSYDRKCLDLAEHFMSDEPEMNCEEACDELAQVIQTAVEDWIADRRDERGLAILAVRDDPNRGDSEPGEHR